MIDVELEGVDEVNDLLSRIPKENFDATKAVFKDSITNIHKEVTDRIRFGPLNSRTGQLARSMTTSVEGSSMRNISARVYTKSPYAPIQELGGTVRAKRAYKGLKGGPYLNIPASANKTSAGVMRSPASSVFSQGGYIVPITSPRARYAVMLNGVPMFWLVKDVKIPPRLGLIKATEDEVPTLLSSLDQVLQEGYED
jgi:phage gpG-like protein